MKPDYSRDGIELYQGDCLALLPELEAGSVDAVVTDPPYGIGYKHSGGGRHGMSHNNRRNTRAIANDNRPFDPTHLLVWQCVIWGVNHWGCVPRGGTMLAWDKRPNGAGPDDSFADCEFAWTSAKVKRNVFRWLWKGIACCKKGEDNGRRYHPTTKPIALMKWCVDIVCPHTDATILDPYMGSGTTGVACIRTGRKFIGMEIDEKYFDIAVKRIEAEFDRHPLFEAVEKESQTELFSETSD